MKYTEDKIAFAESVKVLALFQGGSGDPKKIGAAVQDSVTKAIHTSRAVNANVGIS